MNSSDYDQHQHRTKQKQVLFAYRMCTGELAGPAGKLSQSLGSSSLLQHTNPWDILNTLRPLKAKVYRGCAEVQPAVESTPQAEILRPRPSASYGMHDMRHRRARAEHHMRTLFLHRRELLKTANSADFPSSSSPNVHSLLSIQRPSPPPRR